MLTIKHSLADGSTGVTTLEATDKWTFGRPDGASDLTVAVDDQRISRNALVIRDSGPGPVVFRGQRGEFARLGLRSDDGSVTWLDEGTAGNLTAEAHVVEFFLGEELILTIDVEFAQRGSVAERRESEKLTRSRRRIFLLLGCPSDPKVERFVKRREIR